MMSFGRTSSNADKLGQRSSMEEPPKEKPKSITGDQDYVLVEDGEEASESVRAASMSPVPVISSPAPVEATLEAAPAEVTAVSGLKLDTTTLAAWREQQLLGRANSVGTDRTDYSGLNDHSNQLSLSERDQALQKALEEANQQHQWAMEAVIRGWEAEKGELMAKLEKMTEARDTLEAELKHSENSFAGMLEGMLDHKLDQMLRTLQDCGAKTPMAGSSTSSPSTAVALPGSRKAQQVSHDIERMLEGMKHVTTIPEPGSESSDSNDSSRRFYVDYLQAPNLQSTSPRAGSQPGRKNILQRSVMSAGGFFNQARHLACDKVPKALNASADFASKAVTAPIHCAGHQAGQLRSFLQASGVQNEHLTAVAGAVVGILATTILIKTKGGRRVQAPEPLPFTDDSCECHEIEIMGPDSLGDDDGTVEIILNRNGVYRRSGHDDPALVVAWPI